MSESAIDVVRRHFDESLAAPDAHAYWVEHGWAEDIDWRAIEGAPDDAGPILGLDAMRAYTGEWYEMFDDFAFEAEELLEAPDGRIVAVQHISGTAKGSGVPTDMRFATVVEVRDGRIARGREYATLDEAKRAAGID